MKRWILIQATILVLALMIGLICKAGFTDNGVMAIRTVQDVEQLDCNMNQVFDDGDSLGIFEEDFSDEMIADLEVVADIFIATPLNHLRQYDFTMTQELEIQHVIRGNAIKGEKIELVMNGGVYDNKYAAIRFSNSRPAFYGLTNLMIPGNKYLIFSTALEINKYTRMQRYRIESPMFHVLNLSSDFSIPVAKPLTEVSYHDYKGSEFFCESQRILGRVLEIKHNIIKHFGTERSDVMNL